MEIYTKSEKLTIIKTRQDRFVDMLFTDIYTYNDLYYSLKPNKNTDMNDKTWLNMLHDRIIRRVEFLDNICIDYILCNRELSISYKKLNNDDIDRLINLYNWTIPERKL